MIIAIPALDRHNYRDLRVLLESIKMYVGEKARTYVFYKGHAPERVGLRQNNFIHFIPQHPENKHFGHACLQILEVLEGKDVVFVNDDTVFTPTTWDVLVDDVQKIHAVNIPLGLLGLRTNFSAGLQNIRSQHGTMHGMKWSGEDLITEVDTVYGTAFLFTAEGQKAVSGDWTEIQWYGDNLLSYDLRQQGFRNFVSRAYIHHHGSQSGTAYEQYDREAKAWLKENRPDFPLT